MKFFNNNWLQTVFQVTSLDVYNNKIYKSYDEYYNQTIVTKCFIFAM